MLKSISSGLVIAVLASQVALAGFYSEPPAYPQKTPDSSLLGPFSTNPQETIATIGISGVASWDSFGAPDNEVLVYDLGASIGCPGEDVEVTGIGWDAIISTVGASWASEATIDFNGAVALAIGAGDDAPTPPGGTAYSSGGILDLTMLDDGMGGTLDLSFVAVGGILTLEFFESFDDASGAVDAYYLADSTLQVEYAKVVPEPATFSLLGLAALSLLVRRRK